jgi:hypothetical protein
LERSRSDVGITSIFIDGVYQLGRNAACAAGAEVDRMRLAGRAQPALAALAVTAALTGCGGTADSAPALSTPAASGDGRPCAVTVPGRNAPFASEGFNHGNRHLGVALWPKGRLVAGILPDGSANAEIERDGSISAKLGWWRAVEGRLSIEGERLDGPAPPLSAHVPDGYPPAGFQPTGLTFPTEGCWKVVGRVGDASLTFVVLVRSLRGRQRGDADR